MTTQINNKSKYLDAFISLASKWLTKPEASDEYNYLLSRVPQNKWDIFHFGFFPKSYSSAVEFMDEYGSLINEEPIPALQSCQLLYLTEKTSKIVPFFKNHHLLIPFYNVYNKPISLSGRTLLSEAKQKEIGISKYKHLPFAKRYNLFGLNLAYKDIIKKDKVIIVEGQFDCISCYMHGIKNVVALCGSKMIFEQVALLKRFTNNFDILLDNDEAGQSGYDKFEKSKSKFNINTRKIIIPSEYKDIDLCLKDNIDPEEIFS